MEIVEHDGNRPVRGQSRDESRHRPKEALLIVRAPVWGHCGSRNLIGEELAKIRPSLACLGSKRSGCNRIENGEHIEKRGSMGPPAAVRNSDRRQG
jgi:hypothetical protein